MKDIAIYGAGGFGREVACLINKINEQHPVWNLIGFFDDTKVIGQPISHFGYCLGGMNELNIYNKNINIVIAIGTPQKMFNIVSKITNSQVTFPNIIHPDFVLNDPDTFKIGIGNIILSGCSATCDIEIGNFNIFNCSIALGHDDKIGNYNSFMPAVRISGSVIMGDCNFFGVGSIIIQGIKIGNNISLGAGSVLISRVKDGVHLFGVPAVKI